MNSTETSNLEIVHSYLRAIEQGDDEKAASFYSPDVVQEELPNRLVASGAKRDLAALREAAARGKKVISAQRYEVKSAVAAGDRVALEMVWTGTLSVPFGSIPAGGTMRAFCAMFLDMRDGKIVGQRNYDCFEPW